MATAPGLDERFEEERSRLLVLATRMLGSRTEAEDALQEVWLRIRRVDGATVDNPPAWLTTVTARVCLNVLRARDRRPEDELDPTASTLDDAVDPQGEAVLSDAVGLALHVVVDRLTPLERVAFVLHDLFGVPFDEIAPVVGRSVGATRQLASRARRRVQGVDAELVVPDRDPGERRRLVDAFFAAARRGDLTALVAVLHPEVVLRVDWGLDREVVVSGAEAVAGRAVMFARPDADLVPVLVADEVGVVVVAAGRTVSVMVFTVDGDAVVAIESTTDRDRIHRLLGPGLPPRPAGA